MKHPEFGPDVSSDPGGYDACVGIRTPTNSPAPLTASYYADLGPVCAVLRSWKDRFRAFPVAIGFDTLTFAVQRPPSTHEAALSLAAEHRQGIGSVAALRYASGGISSVTDVESKSEST